RGSCGHLRRARATADVHNLAALWLGLRSGTRLLCLGLFGAPIVFVVPRVAHFGRAAGAGRLGLSRRFLTQPAFVRLRLWLWRLRSTGRRRALRRGRLLLRLAARAVLHGQDDLTDLDAFALLDADVFHRASDA